MSHSIINVETVTAEARRIVSLSPAEQVSAIVKLVDETALEAAQGVIALLPTALALHSVLPGSGAPDPRTLN